MSFFSSPPDIVQTQSSEEGFAPDVLTVAGHSCYNARGASTDSEDAQLPSTKSRKPSSKRMGCLGLLTQEVVPRQHTSKFVSRCIHHCSCPVAVLSTSTVIRKSALSSNSSRILSQAIVANIGGVGPHTRRTNAQDLRSGADIGIDHCICCVHDVGCPYPAASPRWLPRDPAIPAILPGVSVCLYPSCKSSRDCTCLCSHVCSDCQE